MAALGHGPYVPPPADPPPEPKSFLRALVGVLSLLSSMVVLPVGFVVLVTGLQDGSYNTRVMVNALGVLALGGGLLALGVSMLIWEMSVRYGVRK
jgi:hypothetical protein